MGLGSFKQAGTSGLALGQGVAGLAVGYHTFFVAAGARHGLHGLSVACSVWRSYSRGYDSAGTGLVAWPGSGMNGAVHWVGTGTSTSVTRGISSGEGVGCGPW